MKIIKTNLPNQAVANKFYYSIATIADNKIYYGYNTGYSTNLYIICNESERIYLDIVQNYVNRHLIIHSSEEAIEI